MTTKIRFAALLLLGVGACATGGAGASRSSGDRFYQADQRMPEVSAFSEDAERAFYKDMRTHEQRADMAQSSGNLDQARAEWAAAAEGFGSFEERFGASEWQVPIRFHAAELFMYAQQWDKAAEQAEKTGADRHANEKTKAMAARLAAAGWLNAANMQVKAGKADPIKLAYVDQRKGEPLNPRSPPGPWKRFVDASDNYLARLDADPEMAKPGAERRSAIPPAQLALIAAEVQYAFDNIEEARRRFDAIIARWPGDAEIMENAVPLYLQTFLLLKDDAGYQAALERVQKVVAAEAKKASDPKQQAAYQKVLDVVGRSEAGSRFSDAQKLLDAGKPAEAARSFEALAAENKPGSDIAGALHNAALAWDKASDGAKAAALRERIVKEFPDSKVAPLDALLVAAHLSRKGAHLESARAYSEFSQRWPGSPNRCLALQNVAAEYDMAKKPVDAAERYLVFGKDPACTQADPNFAARALYRSGQLFKIAKLKAKAKDAFTAAAAVQGVTDTVAKSQVDDARKQLKGSSR